MPPKQNPKMSQTNSNFNTLLQDKSIKLLSSRSKTCPNKFDKKLPKNCKNLHPTPPTSDSENDIENDPGGVDNPNAFSKLLKKDTNTSNNESFLNLFSSNITINKFLNKNDTGFGSNVSSANSFLANSPAVNKTTILSNRKRNFDSTENLDTPKTRELLFPRSKTYFCYPTPPTDDSLYSSPASNKKLKLEDEFIKSLQPKRLLEWSDDKNDFLTLQNYMTSLRYTKAKFPKNLNEKIINRHDELEIQMRSILLDWLMEVCDCFQLQRSTFYLAQAFLDHYLSINGKNLEIQQFENYLNNSARQSPCLAKIDEDGGIEDENSKDYNIPNEKYSSENVEKLKKQSARESESMVSKTQLQLLGITSLFVAAKIEEIDPPRLVKFAFITDGACKEEDILLQEVTLLQSLEWCVHHVTSYDWLRLYLQTTYFYLVKSKANINKSKSALTTLNSKLKKTIKQETVPKKQAIQLCNLEVSLEFIETISFTPVVFTQMCQLLDLATLDINCLKFKPHELAASILYHFSSQTTARKASNLNMHVLVECVSWLTSMALTLRDHGLNNSTSDYSKVKDDVRNYRACPPSQWYNLQVHDGEMLDLLETSKERRRLVENRSNRRK